MGLDMYLEVKRAKGPEGQTGLTGACGGLFGLAPASDNEEVGYWRKFYELDNFISNLQHRESEDNAEAVELTTAQLFAIMQYCVEKANDFVKGEDITEYEANGDLLDYEYTVAQWTDAANTFGKALQMALNGDTVYYRNWY